MSYTFKKYKSSSEIPHNWNDVIGRHNIMLSKEYFVTLETSCPENMKCFYVGFFNEDELIGGALFQYLNFIQHKTFQKDETFCNVKNFTAKKLSKNVMILGNNMLTGQNGFYFDASKITVDEVICLIDEAVREIQKQEGKTSLIIYKDYQKGFIKYFQDKNHRSFYRFSVQPNMVLSLKESWSTFEDYLNAFSTKYRTRAKSAKKKIIGIKKSTMNLDDIRNHQKKMNLLYQNVAENAPFNTFFLTENHFESMKESLGENFKVFGYYLDEKLIGFYTLILNNKDIDTYFLGYNKALQKEKQIYLNMLLDMAEFGITEKFNRIIFGRTALEIKSTIGAQPVEIFGLIKHNNFLINQFMERIFKSFNPVVEWIQRKPFKS
ncbi:peptidogalycan biosysnthesis protein [Chryseobacterium chendengshani]|uniref:peptidogalycan biosysnthesis protein n=1 Tax=Chryseobacterium sp. LJ668 TaxID=2864040 RepID=UPI001C691710|nr:peptidogalycan biosysnthesis protein [Chryseobacterium sp. LJ668]MBW8524466.1 peptidogalycan biosysnthesis protein [Chryseobacterium sp. LJ668]QYK15292.1 peptidogalycan biosysnthesis protein [Chryseobacterium sp. LJ668]